MITSHRDRGDPKSMLELQQKPAKLRVEERIATIRGRDIDVTTSKIAMSRGKCPHHEWLELGGAKVGLG